MVSRRTVTMGLAGVILAGCNKDDGLVVVAEPPVVTIVEPAVDATFYDGQTIQFKALVTADPSIALTDVSHTWVTGSTTMCTAAPVQADGFAVCDFAFDDFGEQSVTVTVVDPRGETASASIALNILENTPPTIEIIEPADNEVFGVGDLIVFTANTDDAEDDPDALTVSVESSIQGDLGVTATPASDGMFTFAKNDLASGDHYITFRIFDSSGRSGQDAVIVSVNDPPGPPVVSIDPDPTSSGEELEAVIDVPSSDPEGDAITYEYEWVVNGASYSVGTNPRLPMGVTVRGDFVEVYVTPDDGFGLGPPGTDSVTVGNSPPRISSVTVTPSSPDTDDDLLATSVGWFDQDGDTERYRYAWYHNGALDSSETTDTFPNEKTIRGDTVQVEVTPYDLYDDGVEVLSGTITIGNTAPTTPSVTITPSVPERDDSLVCNITVPSSDIDGDSITYSYNWYQNGTLTSITSNTVAASYTNDGDVWECRVTPSDGYSSGVAGTANVTVVDITAPDEPFVDTPTRYRNEDEMTLTGDCEAGCALTITCADSTSSWTESDTCASDNSFTHTLSLTRGETTDCWVECEDASGNVSPTSDTVTTEVCDPYDTYEDSTGYGDAIADNIDLWAVLDDSGSTTITITGNALEYGDADWYLISTSDDNAANAAAGANAYNFDIDLTAGASNYEFEVYRGSTVSSGYPSTKDCSSTSGGVTNYNDDYVSPWRGTNECRGSNTYGYDICEDMSDDYYIVVKHNSTTALSCQEYTLTITNGK